MLSPVDAMRPTRARDGDFFVGGREAGAARSTGGRRPPPSRPLTIPDPTRNPTRAVHTPSYTTQHNTTHTYTHTQTYPLHTQPCSSSSSWASSPSPLPPSRRAGSSPCTRTRTPRTDSTTATSTSPLVSAQHSIDALRGSVLFPSLTTDPTSHAFESPRLRTDDKYQTRKTVKSFSLCPEIFDSADGGYGFSQAGLVFECGTVRTTVCVGWPMPDPEQRSGALIKRFLCVFHKARNLFTRTNRTISSPTPTGR